MVVGRTILIAVGMLAAAVWVGSLVCLAIVSRVAARELDGAARVSLFRAIGRSYGIVGSICLLVAIVVGLVFAAPLSDASGTVVAAVVVSLVLVVVAGLGMAQARRMTVRRRVALASPHDRRAARAVQQGAALAGVLRGGIGALTLAVVVLVAAQLAG